MSKEIIIDDVNVAGCKDYREVEYKEMPICMNYYNHLPKPPKETEWQYCVGNKNCHYKQLKRLQAENEELKAENETLKEKLDFLKNNTYRKALRKIREYINDNTDFDKGDYFQNKTPAYDILRIIALYGE